MIEDETKVNDAGIFVAMAYMRNRGETPDEEMPAGKKRKTTPKSNS